MILIFNQNLLVQSNVLQTEKTISLIELIQSSGTAGQIIIGLLFILLLIGLYIYFERLFTIKAAVKIDKTFMNEIKTFVTSGKIEKAQSRCLKEEIPVIAFGKGCWFALGEMAKSGASALGVDWTCSPRNARCLTGGNITLQGNFDPTRLFSPPAEIKRMVTEMINAFGKDKYIVNLGHGILPNIPLENAGAFIEAVKEYKAER